MRTFFNRPLLMIGLMVLAVFTCYFIMSDGLQKRHVFVPSVAMEMKFLENDSRRAFNKQATDWLEQSGYESTEQTWRELTGKAASSDGTGVREDLQLYVKRLSGRSFQVWGFGQPVKNFGLTQVYRAMYVSEWSQEKADQFRDEFEGDTKRLQNLSNIGRTY